MAKTIMIVDDSESWRMVAKLALTRAGYDVVEAGNGVEALDQLEHNKIHLVVCDVNMPNMDGIQFVRELKRHSAHRFLPVVMVTTEGQEEKIQQGKEAGAKAWMLKPFRAEQLLAVIAKFVLP